MAAASAAAGWRARPSCHCSGDFGLALELFGEGGDGPQFAQFGGEFGMLRGDEFDVDRSAAALRGEQFFQQRRDPSSRWSLAFDKLSASPVDELSRG